MKKAYFAGLLVGAIMFGAAQSAGATTLTLLNDYRVTNNTNDVIHIGDQTSGGLGPYKSQIIYGTEVTFNFDLTDLFLNTDFNLSISTWEVNYNAGYLDYVYLNGTNLGRLSQSVPPLNDLSIWGTDTFELNTDILMVENNKLTIRSFSLNVNYDDFDLTNIYLTYQPVNQPVPEPATMFLFSTGIAGLAGTRIRRKKK